MKPSKAEINRAIKASGGVLKRTKGEIVHSIQFHIAKYGQESLEIVATLLWSLGFDPEEARAAARRLIIKTLGLTASTTSF